MRLHLSIALLLLVMLSPGPASAQVVEVSLDFAALTTQIDAADGASACQFDGGGGSEQNATGGVAMNAYSTLGGFPDDSSDTDYGRFLDVCFSSEIPKGMALHHLWVTPSSEQSPAEALAKSYAECDWAAFDFSIYEARGLMKPPEWKTIDNAALRGHTVPILEGALRRARGEGHRMLLWVDNHFTFPRAVWKTPTDFTVDPEKWEEAALHLVVFVRYLVSCYGVPVHALCFINEPCWGDVRPCFTEEEALRFQTVLRQKLDEAGLTGVKLFPASWDKMYEYLGPQIDLMEQHPDLAELVDIVGGHHFAGQQPDPEIAAVERTSVWVSSGNYRRQMEGGRGYLMGPDTNIDETVRLVTSRLANGFQLSGVWELYNRAGVFRGGFHRMPAEYDPSSTGTPRQIDGAAAFLPYVRPGMFVVKGSQGRSARQGFSVDGFNGRGYPPVIMVTNSNDPRTFRIRLAGFEEGTEFEVHQAHAGSAKSEAGMVHLEDGVLELAVPADSVTALVAKGATTEPRAYLIVQDPETLTGSEGPALRKLRELGLDVELLSEELTAAQKDAYQVKRHPVDPMGTACYVIGPSIRDESVARAYSTVMAPVVVCSRDSARFLKVNPGSRIEAGGSLSMRDALDPPAEMLPGGRPLAPGPRAALQEGDGTEELAAAVRWALEADGVFRLTSPSRPRMGKASSTTQGESP